MTDLHLVYIASITGAIAFFLAGLLFAKILARPKPLQKHAPIVATGPLGETLSKAIERFDSAAIADTIGLPLASRGSHDGTALAAYGALLQEAADRAADLLSVATPVAIDIVGSDGTRTQIRPFQAEENRMLLVNVGDDARDVDATIRELSAHFARRTREFPSPPGV